MVAKVGELSPELQFLLGGADVSSGIQAKISEFGILSVDKFAKIEDDIAGFGCNCEAGAPAQLSPVQVSCLVSCPDLGGGSFAQLSPRSCVVWPWRWELCSIVALVVVSCWALAVGALLNCRLGRSSGDSDSHCCIVFIEWDTRRLLQDIQDGGLPS